MMKQGDESGWKSSSRGEQAWKEATDDVASRNAEARRAGRSEREAYERRREDSRRAAEAKRHARLLAGRPGRRGGQR